MGKKIGIHLGTFVGTLLFLWLWLFAVSCIPNESIRAHMEESALSYRQKEAYQFTGGGKFNSIEDNYADAILLGVVWNLGKGRPVVASLDTKYYDGEDYGESYGLYLSLYGQEANRDYSRYWHGSAVFIRPLLLVTDVNGIKWIGFWGISLLAALVCVILWKKEARAAAAGLVFSLLCVQFWNVRLSLEYIPSFLAAMCLCLLFLMAEKKGNGCLTVLSVAGGVLIAFTDFLTTETITILLPLILVFWVRRQQGRLGSLRDNLILGAQCLGAWGMSYILTFLVKWGAASLATGENKFAAALSSAEHRIFDGEAGEKVTALQQFCYAVPANLSTLFGGEGRIDGACIWGGLLVTLLVGGGIFYLFRETQDSRDITILLLALGCLPYVRYLVLSNHSYLHEFFTYRAQCATVLALCGILWFHIKLPVFKKKNTGAKRQKKHGGGRRRQVGR